MLEGSITLSQDGHLDDDFISVMGHLTIVSDDDGAGTVIVAHESGPDTNPPGVNMVNPRNGAVNQKLTSRVGVTFTDRIDLRSLDNTTFIVRPMAGSALEGRFSEQVGMATGIYGW